jgi:hypothetical protein
VIPVLCYGGYGAYDGAINVCLMSVITFSTSQHLTLPRP